MKVKIVGIQAQDYKLDSGYSFKGKKIHCIDLESKPDGLTGELVTNFKIADESPLSSIPLAVGHIYTAYFNQKGALDYLVENKQ